MIRRNLLRAAAALAGAPAALAGAPIARAVAAPSDAIPPWTKEQGASIQEDHYGTP